MAFRFSLKTVLKYREELEKREEQALERRRELLASLQTKLAEVKQARCRSLAELESLLEHGILGDDLHHVTAQQRQLERLELDYQGQVADALSDFDEQMKLFLAARQKREILDELKSAQQNCYTVQQDRRDQNMVDETFIARFKRDT
jgi:flagellar export protein FliJ